MTIIWSPDTCDCILEIDASENNVDWIQKCDLHKALNDQAWIDAVVTHNLTFQISIGNQGMKANRTDNMVTKRAAKAAIKAGGATTKNPLAPRRFRNN